MDCRVCENYKNWEFDCTVYCSDPPKICNDCKYFFSDCMGEEGGFEVCEHPAYYRKVYIRNGISNTCPLIKEYWYEE